MLHVSSAHGCRLDNVNLLTVTIINYPTKETFPFFLRSQIKIPHMKMNNILYRHARITPCSGNVKSREIGPFTRKQDFFKSKRVLFPMSQKILKISNLTESYEDDILKKKQQKEYWLPSMSDVTSSELGYIVQYCCIPSKHWTLRFRLIIGEFWPIIHVRLYIKCLSGSIYGDLCGFSVTLGTAPSLIWKHLFSFFFNIFYSSS